MINRPAHTYAVLEISHEAYQEIREKLAAASYQHAFVGDVIDMHGIALSDQSAALPRRMEQLEKGSANV